MMPSSPLSCGDSVTSVNVKRQKWNGYCRYQQAFWALKCTKHFAEGRLLLATNSQSYQLAYQSLWLKPVKIHPIVNFVPALSIKRGLVKTPKVLLYLGSVKRDKGLQFILDSVGDICLEFPKIDFLIHLNPECPGMKDFPNGVNYLSRLQSNRCNFSLINFALSQRDYENLLRNAHEITSAIYISSGQVFGYFRLSRSW